MQPVRAGALPFALGVLLLACAERGGASAAPPRAVTIAPAPSSDVSVAEPSEAAPPLTAPTGPLALLGQPCGDAPPGIVEYCARDGRVAGLRAPQDLVRDVPPPAAEIVHDARSREMPGRSLRVGIERERLWFRQITCQACRRVMGWAFVGDLERLSDEQLGEIQVLLGLPAHPPLTTAPAWRSAFAERN